MLLVLERVLQPVTQFPERFEVPEDDARLNVSVVFTSVDATIAALKKAGILAASLRARITLFVPQLVPYPLPLESPPVLIDWNERRFREIAGSSAVETTVRVYLCRDRRETLNKVLGPKSLVVIGGPKRWWPFTSEKRLAMSLRRHGHEVILTTTE